MKDYIESTKNEFSYEIEDIIYEEEWTGFHIKMISGEWLDKKKVDDVEWSHYVDILIPNETITETGIMFIDGGDKDENYFRLDSISVGYALKTKSIMNQSITQKDFGAKRLMIFFGLKNQLKF